MNREVISYCRICEAHCGLRVELGADGEVARIRPDRDHPVTRGYGCVKGFGLGEIHRDPNRLDVPLKRVDGRFEPISWEQAIAEIGGRIRAIRERHGPRAIGMYRGNPSYFSFQHLLFADDFMRAVGSPNVFTSVSVDSNNKFFVATEMFGHPMLQLLPDISRTDFLLCLGTNPAVSQMSIIQLPHALRRLQEIVDRGGTVITADPRRTETADRVGEHRFIRPGTDAALLLAMIHVVAGETSPSKADRLDLALAAAASWTPERAAPITGIPAPVIREIALAYARAPGACVYHSTGVNMSGFGSLCTWLIHVLALVSGNLDAAGGHVLGQGAFDLVGLSPGQARGRDEHRTLAHGWRRVAGAFPSGALVDEIELDHPERIRALIVSAGNPVHSLPGDRFAGARDRLELLVAIDLYLGETASMADYVLPATDMLEHSDFPIGWMLFQETPYTQYTRAVVPPRGERREEWRIFSDLAMASGVGPFGTTVCHLFPWINRILPGAWELTPDHVLAVLLWWGGQVTLQQLIDQPSGVLGPPTTGGTLADRLRRKGQQIDAAPASILPELDRFEAWCASREPGLRLVGLRERHTHNSWMHNHPTMRQPRQNRLRIHPRDAAERGISDGDLVRVDAGGGEVQIRVTVTDEMMPGVVALPHGWGHDRSGVDRARALGGANINATIPGGPEHMEASSGQAHMTGHAVEVTRVREST